MFLPAARPANLTVFSLPGVNPTSGFPFAEPINSHRHVYALCNPSSSADDCTAQFEDDLWSCAKIKCSQQLNSAIDRSSKFRIAAAASATQPATPSDGSAPPTRSSSASVSAAASALQDGTALHQCMRSQCAPQYIAAYSLACVDLESTELLSANVRLEGMPPVGLRRGDQEANAVKFKEYSARATLRAAGLSIPPPPNNSNQRIGICTLSQPIGSRCDASKLSRSGEISDANLLPISPEVKYWPALGTVVIPKLGPSMPDAFDLSIPQNYYLPTVTCNATSNTLIPITSTRSGACTTSKQCLSGTCIDNKCALDTAKSTLTASDLDAFISRRDQSSTPSSMPVSTIPAQSSSSGPPEPVIFMLPVVALVAVMVWISVKRHSTHQKRFASARNLRGLGQMTSTGRPGLLGITFAPTSSSRPALDAWGPRAASDRAAESFHGCSSMSLERGHAMLEPLDHETLPRYSTFAHRMSMMFVSAVMTTLGGQRRASMVGVDEEEVGSDLAGAPPVPPLPAIGPEGPVAAEAAEAAANAIMPPPPSYDVHREHSIVDVSVAGSVRSSRPSVDTFGTVATATAPAASRPSSLLRVSLSRQQSVRALSEQVEARVGLLTPVNGDVGGDADDGDLGSVRSIMS
ncbi:hypothetical protein BCR44DRAFT_36611 [Catenaria anguillulae PL171]|uniref:Uncharacterized protein n=1 Tax=Catenaria anguillulae PL171 TaxID=765915 RepID=A0A1Y2HM09_9FUNG|nr:hypothetical protein BCR44DRAFT_36611 [Catenaria anguillulae PL171]